MSGLSGLAASARELAADYHLLTANFLNGPLPGVASSGAEAAFELNNACAISTDSALLLVSDMHVWDADILARSVAEGTLKALYILLADGDELESRAHEFFDTVPRFQAFIRYRRAEQLLAQVDNPNAPEWAGVHETMKLDAEAFRDSQGTSNGERQLIQTRWSFGGLVEQLAALESLQPIAVLGFKYAMQSHSVHKDADGTGWIYARQERDPLERDAADSGHGARIVHDLLDMATWRAAGAARVSSEDPSALVGLEARNAAIRDALRKLEPAGLRDGRV